MFDLFSFRRKRAQNAGRGDVYQYDNVPPILRTQIQQIAIAAIGNYTPPTDFYSSEFSGNEYWERIEKIICRENGVHQLTSKRENPRDDILNYIGSVRSAEGFIDIVELILKVIDTDGRNWHEHARYNRGITQQPDETIAEVNARFKRAEFGYQYENGNIIRVDSEYIHSEIVRPAIFLLSSGDMAGPNEEFLKAHKHYRSGEYKEAVMFAGNAFESTIKSICARRRWNYDKGARVSDLIKILKIKKFWPSYMDNSFDHLIATLNSSLPPVRNNNSAHGQGSDSVSTPKYIAQYAIHLAAVKINFLVETDRQR